MTVKKHVRQLLFCLGISTPLSLRIGLILPYMLGLDVISFFQKHVLVVFLFYCFQHKKKIKKKIGEKMQNLLLLFFSFDSFSDIACLFT
jgi:hypothetical protein